MALMVVGWLVEPERRESGESARVGCTRSVRVESFHLPSSFGCSAGV